MQIIRKIRHPSRDFTVPIVVAKIPIVVAIPGSDGGDCFHGSKKHSSLPPAAARLLKGCTSSLYHCFFLPYDGNASSSQRLQPAEAVAATIFSKNAASLMEASSKASSEDSKATFDEMSIDHHHSNYYSDAISLLNGLPPLWPPCSQQRLPWSKSWYQRQP